VARTAISFPVALHAQRAPDLCWMASLLMLESWFYTVLPNSHRPRAITVADHMGLRTIGNPPLAAADLAPFARYAGLEIVRKQATGAEAFSLLQTFGPLWYGGSNNGYRNATLGGHAVVITGISGADVLINDPAPNNVGTQLKMRARDFFAQLRPFIRPAPFLVIREDAWPRR
jgi:hypothetical protein